MEQIRDQSSDYYDVNMTTDCEVHGMDTFNVTAKVSLNGKPILNWTFGFIYGLTHLCRNVALVKM